MAIYSAYGSEHVVSNRIGFSCSIEIKTEKNKVASPHIHNKYTSIRIIAQINTRKILKRKKRTDKWLQHVHRMDTNRLLKQALQYKPKGRKKTGRPRKRWRDQLHLQDQRTGNTPNPSGTCKYKFP